MNYYVYYKIAPERVAQIGSQVQSLFRKIEEQIGIRGRWMHRRDDPTTYMEVYEGVEGDDEGLAAFEALLEREGAKLGVPRKVERFVCA